MPAAGLENALGKGGVECSIHSGGTKDFKGLAQI
jgi:hypothetical protein